MSTDTFESFKAILTVLLSLLAALLIVCYFWVFVAFLLVGVFAMILFSFVKG